MPSQPSNPFPIGFHNLHPQPMLNFQMNRWLSWVSDPSMAAEIGAIAPGIQSFIDWKAGFLTLSDRAESTGQLFKAAYYLRAAEFFMPPSDSDKKGARDRFRRMMRDLYNLPDTSMHLVPYRSEKQEGVLPAYRFPAETPSGTILFCGGFDSCIEELFPALVFLRDRGFDVIAFDGPGQGSALYDYGLPLTPDWHLPVSVVLDFFGLADVTLIGLSLGGCLAVRAAAFEPRVKRVIAYDVLTDFASALLHQVSPFARALVKIELDIHTAPGLNAVLELAARYHLDLDWALWQGMWALGVGTPFDFLQATRPFTTRDISKYITQDVLLLAGSDDKLVPEDQFLEQIEMIKNACSLTARLFTHAEQAQGHCQAGNYGLAYQTIVDWLSALRARDAKS